jgi:DNA-directed RNA polymerase specialized sigma subunit
MIRVSSADEDRRVEITLTLRRYRSKVAEYQACRDLYNQLFPSGTIQLTDMPKAAADTYEPERWAQRRWDQRDRMERSLQAMLDALDEIESVTACLEGDEKAVIVRRYFIGETMDQVAESIGKSEQWCYNMQRKAINKIIQEGKQ